MSFSAHTRSRKASPRTSVTHVTSQIRAVASSDAVTTRLPSPLNAALSTESSWPFRTAISLPLSASQMRAVLSLDAVTTRLHLRSEEHTSELQSLTNLVCRLLLEKKKTTHT